MFAAIVSLLIYICLIVALGYLILWVLQQIGVPLPAQVIKILWVVVALICLLLIFQAVAPALSSGSIHLPR